jgi:PIN domain nuclease of toxin-antitoxin system
LLDTHVFLWFLADDPRLPDQLKNALEDPDNDLLVSSISEFEVAIKHSLGKLPLPLPLGELFGTQLEVNRIEMLPITLAHYEEYVRLPFPSNGHRDPFDRLLISQARSEEMNLYTCDSALKAYGPPVSCWG